MVTQNLTAIIKISKNQEVFTGKYQDFRLNTVKFNNYQRLRMKAAIYIRVSTQSQEGKNQENQIISYCHKQGYEIFKVYSDVISGKEDKRPGFDALFNDARMMLFDIVIFWDLSRFSRSGTLFTLQKLKELTNLGIKWHSLQEPYFSSMGEFGDVIISIMATLSKIERQKISERTKAGLKDAKNVGKRGKDKKPRKIRSDRGLKRGSRKSYIDVPSVWVK